MKKTLIASAIAATLTGNAYAMSSDAADLASKIDAMPTIYGTIELVHRTLDRDPHDPAEKKHEFEDNGSTIGIKHVHAISDGITAFAKAEFEFRADENDDTGINKLDEAYIGLKGDFGSVQIGKDETVYDWVDVLDTSEHAGIGAQYDLNEGDNFQYVSPLLADGLLLGLTAPIDSDSNFGGALAAQYTVDNLQVALAYALGRDETAVTEDILGLSVAFTMDNLHLMAQYETQDDTKDVWGLMGMYTMGQNVFALGYQMSSFDASGSEDQSDIYLQALHNLSDNAYIYLEYLMQTDVEGTEDSDLDTLAVGATYKF